MGQTTTTAKYWCLKTEMTLEQVVGDIFPGMVETETFGTAAAIQDSEVNGIIEKVQTASPFAKPTATSNREVQVKYHKPDCADSANADVQFDCNDVADTPEIYGYDKATVDDYVGEEFSITIGNYDDTCESPMKELAQKMKTAWRKMYKSYNDKLLTKAYAGIGNYYTDAGGTPVNSLTNPRALKLFTGTAPARPQPMGLFPIIEQYQRMGVGDKTPVVIGGSAKFRAWQFSQGIYEGNLDGFDSSKAIGLNLYTDYRVDPIGNAGTIAGTERAITFTPGAMSVLEWFQFDNPLKEITQSGRSVFAPVQASNTLVRQKIDLGSAYNGRPFIVDMQIKYNECSVNGPTISYKFRKDFDLWKIPQDAFQAACNQAHNYCLLWDISCADVDCSDLM